MKKTILLSLNLFFAVVTFAQDTISIKHKQYTTLFSKSKRYPIVVDWWVTKESVLCSQPVKRANGFSPDPNLIEFTNLEKDYLNSGFDRGHMSPSKDNLCYGEEIQKECFYFSNISAQYHSLNAGDWKSLENFTRESLQKNDSIHVWCGNIGELKKIGNTSVPKICWKVIYLKKEDKFRYFIFDNDNKKPDGWENNEVTKQNFEKLVKLKLK